MKESDNLITEIEMRTFREGIKKKYRQYHLLDRDRFPDFEYNTNRANYGPLRESFEDEFYVVRGLDRNSPTIHIPSTNTLALLFTDDSYVPSRRIRTTCQLYVEGKENADQATDSVFTTQSKGRQAIKTSLLPLLVGFLVLIVGFVAAIYLTRSSVPPRASKLTINQPHHGQTVPRVVYVEGKVANADLVWIVIRPMKRGEKCYVQSPAVVQKDGTWKGAAYVGMPGKGTAGMAFQVRAFVNPGGKYSAIDEEGKYIFDSWPEEAELASEPVVVVRGSDG